MTENFVGAVIVYFVLIWYDAKVKDLFARILADCVEADRARFALQLDGFFAPQTCSLADRGRPAHIAKRELVYLKVLRLVAQAIKRGVH